MWCCLSKRLPWITARWEAFHRSSPSPKVARFLKMASITSRSEMPFFRKSTGTGEPMKRKLFLFCWLLLFCFLNSSHSFSLLGYRWPNPYFEYFINPENNDVNADSTIQAIRAGANVWNQWCRAIYGGRTTQKVIRNDGKNTVFFRESEYGAIASTYIFHRGPAILDIHIVFWDRKWQFYPGDTGCVQGFYLEDEATHEFGHAIGLGHSEFQGASMF